MKEDYYFIEKYWILCIAFIIICINIGCRIRDSVSSREYEMAEGTVISVKTVKINRTYGRYYHFKMADSEYATIEYKPAEHYYKERFEINAGNRFFHKGDQLPVMYRMVEYDIVEYPAKQDWITGAWLDAGKDYNTPLMIAVMFVIAGIGYLYLIGVLKPKFKNSWIVISIAGMLSGVMLAVYNYKILSEGSEISDEPIVGFFIGILLAFFSFVFMNKMRGISRWKEEEKLVDPGSYSDEKKFKN